MRHSLKFQQCRGFTLMELMVASAMSLAVIAGVLTLFANTQHSHRTQMLNRHIQENGRFALQLVGEDLRMVKYLGMNIQPGEIGTADVAGVSHCGVAGWAGNVMEPITASNNTNPYSSSCIDSDNYVVGTDVLVLRHAESDPIPTSAIAEDGIYLHSSLYSGAIFQANNAGQLDTTGEVSEISESPVSTYRMSSNAYYVRPCSDTGNNSNCGDSDDDEIPTLVREVLSGDNTVAEPLVENVENFQVLFGFDTDSDFTVDRYVNADNVTDWDDVLSVRMFVLIRSPELVAGYEDTNTYAVGDSNVTPSGSDKNHYRKLFSKTLFLRNPALDTTTI